MTMFGGFAMKIATSAASAVLCVGLALAPARADESKIPAKPEGGSFKLGLEPWLGYGQWQIAASKGIFSRRGLEKVELVNFTEDKDINAALASGQIDGANIATHTAMAMAMAAAGLPIKIVMLEDFSMDADAIIAGKDIQSVADLRGKQVAFEQGTTSDILLNYALQADGMSIADIKPVPMPAADAGSALIAKRVPVAVTYEPYLTIARKHDKDVKLLYTAGRDPGLVSDVLVIRTDVLKSRPGQVLALIESWDAALKDYKAHTREGREIIAKSVGSNLADLETAFDGVRYYSLDENKQTLEGDFAKKTFADVLQAAKKAGILDKDVSATDLIDPRFVAAAK
ncbi:MAG: NitT/TauT family transport system substrate-binding protein [Rhodospirillaceae bacterium]|nr:NitT/TauT family transport system substrate-binding protein [Rhodospirillaceae bacterium]